ncbi:hypothetical protein [Haliangium ochraceum]|uniref:PEGA domain-containing protein n=1 Tax=Haliangium ochraceum (strain DSM 14365 / JCM 11303 / SMP-2) TaxID=502025 RepID=D0LFT0_HALO1|nr:hypothetical protein [Haliangium ochraceum]ACY14532.1 hypothetical protein Hoch_1986 [Haliangium ochraceum DSM 14365]
MTWLLCALLALLALLAPAAHAQEAGDGGEDARQRAGALFADGQRAAQAGDFGRAAAQFVRADALAPTPQAVRMIVRTYGAAEMPLLSARWAEELLRRYPYDIPSRALALETIDNLSSRLVRVFVHCDAPCVVEDDASEVPTVAGTQHVLYLPPGSHRVMARFAAGERTVKRVRRRAAQAVTLGFSAPATASAEAGGAADSAGASDGEASAAGAAGSLEPDPASAAAQSDADAMTGAMNGASAADFGPSAVAEHERFAAETVAAPPALPLVVGGVLTAGLSAAAMWSHRDSASLSDAAAAPGEIDQARQRTRLLLGGAAASAALTVAVSVLWARLGSDEDGDPDDGLRAALGTDRERGGYWVGVGGAF